MRCLKKLGLQTEGEVDIIRWRRVAFQGWRCRRYLGGEEGGDLFVQDYFKPFLVLVKFQEGMASNRFDENCGVSVLPGLYC